MSPYNDPNVHVRQRHVSAGHVPVSSSHTIHYRPGSEFDSPAPGPGQFSNYTSQVTAANNGDTVSHHSSYRNTPVPQVSTQHYSTIVLNITQKYSKLREDKIILQFINN